MGSLSPVRSSEPQSIAAFLRTQSFYPGSWATFMSSNGPEENTNELFTHTHNVSSVLPPRISLAKIYQSISSSQPVLLAAFMSEKDPETDIVNKLVAKSGLDRDDYVKKPNSLRASPDLPIEGSHAQRFNLRPIDVEAPVAQIIQKPTLQNELESSAASWASSVSHQHAASIASLYRDIDNDSNLRKDSDQLGDNWESAESQLSRGLRNASR